MKYDDLIAEARADLRNVRRSMPNGQLPSEGRIQMIERLADALESAAADVERLEREKARALDIAQEANRDCRKLAALLAESRAATSPTITVQGGPPPVSIQTLMSEEAFQREAWRRGMR